MVFACTGNKKSAHITFKNLLIILHLNKSLITFR